MTAPRIAPCPGRVEAFRRFVLEAPAKALLLDLDLRFVAHSPSFGAGQSIAGMHINDALPGADALFNEIKTTLAAGAPVHFALQRVAVSDEPGKFIFFRTQVSYWYDDDGNVCGYLCLNQDVTTEQEAELRRREMEILLHAVVENIPATVAVQDAESTQYLLVNKRLAEISRKLPEQMLSRTDWELFTGNASAVESLNELFRRNGLKYGDAAFVDYEVRENTSSAQTIRFKRVSFEDAEDRKLLLTVGEDITDLKRTARALELAANEAKSANTAKSNFLANISHEIRTPLNGVLGMAQAMANDQLSPQQRERLGVIRQSGETLLALLNDLLDMSKIEAGKLQIETLEFDLGDAIGNACGAFRILAEEKGLRFDVQLNDVAGMCRGDPTRLRQVISNLLSNAIKFTEKGAIEIHVARQGDDVHVSVSDTGLGMAPETLGKLFKKFVQADASTARLFGGTGLGLAICHDLVELMGGEMWAESAVGEGSRFHFNLPLPTVFGKVAVPQAPSMKAGNRRGIRILAAEDNQINQRVLEAFLQPAGYETTFVNNGAEAVEAWRNGRWDMILMDVQMPIMDGTEAAAIIRKSEEEEGLAPTPIVALTANAMSHQADEYLSLGMDAVVPKPIESKVLLETIARIADRDRASDFAPVARSA